MASRENFLTSYAAGDLGQANSRRFGPPLPQELQSCGIMLVVKDGKGSRRSVGIWGSSTPGCTQACSSGGCYWGTGGGRSDREHDPGRKPRNFASDFPAAELGDPKELTQRSIDQRRGWETNPCVPQSSKVNGLMTQPSRRKNFANSSLIIVPNRRSCSPIKIEAPFSTILSQSRVATSRTLIGGHSVNSEALLTGPTHSWTPVSPPRRRRLRGEVPGVQPVDPRPEDPVECLQIAPEPGVMLGPVLPPRRVGRVA
jgi:hypothetical protein